MKNAIILLVLILLTCCNFHPFKKNERISSLYPVDGLTADQSERKLAESVNLYIAKHKLDTTRTFPARLNKDLSRPVIAATPLELERLRSAWKSSGPGHDLLLRRFEEVDLAISEGLYFPPEGGQHNQWYQCDACQRGLRTLDPHHHQCPGCSQIYSGFPYDNVLYTRQHSRNLSRAEDAAWAWQITGDEKYARFAAAVLTGYAERYLNYPMLHASVNDKSVDVAAGKNDKYRTAGHISEQTLGEAMLMIPAAKTYDLICHGGVLTDEQKLKIENDFIRAMADCINGYKAGKSNWQTWHNAALLYAGAVTGDGKLIRQALLDQENGFTAQMKISVMPEGMWYENSWGYHYYTLTAMTHLAEGGKHMGLDLYAHPLLKKMYLVAFDYVMGDGSLPRFGDAVQDSPNRPGINQKAFALYRDSRLMSVLPSEITWDGIVLGLKPSAKSTSIQATSKLIPGAGHAILSSNGPGKLSAAITFGPYGGFHGHFDKLSFVFFGYGQELGVDPGRAASQAYRLPIHQEWYKATTGHNAVLVDGKSQGEAEGKCLAFTASEAYTGVTADAGPAFENVLHKRFLLLTPYYMLVVDELKSIDGKAHVFDWLYHNKGLSISCSLPQADTNPGKLPAGYNYLTDIAGYAPRNEEPILVKVGAESVDLHFMMQGTTGDQVFTCKGPLSGVDDRVPMIIIRRKGEKTSFVSILEPVLHSNTPIVSNIFDLSGISSGFRVIHSSGEDLIRFEGEKLEDFIVSQNTGAGEKILLKP